MNAFLKEASDYDKLSVQQRNDIKSQYSKDSGDQKDGKAQPAVISPQKDQQAKVVPDVKQVVKKEKEIAPLGHFNNPYGKPQVAHDDPYLEPFVDDLYLRQNEYKKYVFFFLLFRERFFDILFCTGGWKFSTARRAELTRLRDLTKDMDSRGKITMILSSLNGRQALKAYRFMVISMAGTEMSFGATEMILDAGPSPSKPTPMELPESSTE